ncbi:hypothetical protein ACWF9B_21900 [Streptomyces sp. NPDC055089]
MGLVCVLADAELPKPDVAGDEYGLSAETVVKPGQHQQEVDLGVFQQVNPSVVEQPCWQPWDPLLRRHHVAVGVAATLVWRAMLVEELEPFVLAPTLAAVGQVNELEGVS